MQLKLNLKNRDKTESPRKLNVRLHTNVLRHALKFVTTDTIDIRKINVAFCFSQKPEKVNKNQALQMELKIYENLTELECGIIIRMMTPLLHEISTNCTHTHTPSCLYHLT